MHLGPRLQLSPVELIDEDMLMMSSQVRFLAVVLRWKAAPTGTARLSLPIVKGTYFQMDPHVTVETLMTDVLELESVGYLTTFVGRDGLEYYRIERFTPPGGATAADDADQSEFIGTVGREKRERESERESESDETRPPRALRDPGPPPPRFCSDHAATGGSDGEPCVKCQDRRMDFIAWNYTRTQWTNARAQQTNAQRAPRFEESEG